MQKIYTILANGQVLTPEVMKGVLRQRPRCCLIPVTSEGDLTLKENMRSEEAQQSRVRNLNEVRRICKEEILVLMDSDVILLHKDAIRTLIRELREGLNLDMVTLPTKEKQMKGYRKELEGELVIYPETDSSIIPHSVFAVWRDRFPEVKMVGIGECLTCAIVKILKVKCLYYKKQVEQRDY